MNVRRKSMLAGGLGALAAIVWAPTLASLSSEDPRAPQERPADAAQEDGQQREGATAHGGGSGQAVPEAGALDDLEREVEALDRGRERLDLAGLLASLRTEAGVVETRGAPGMQGGRALDTLADFARGNTLSGIFYGPDRAVALLGHRVVKTGDALAGGRVRVGTIGPDGVELISEEQSIVVELPAFRAGARGTPVMADGAAPGAEQPASEPSAAEAREAGA